MRIFFHIWELQFLHFKYEKVVEVQIKVQVYEWTNENQSQC